MTNTAWYIAAVGVVVLALYAAGVVVAGLCRRRLEIGPAAKFVVSLAAGYLILPAVVPYGPPPPNGDGFTLRYDVRTRTTWIAPCLMLLGVAAGTAALLFAAVHSYRERYPSQLVMVALALALCLGVGGYAAGLYTYHTWQVVWAAERGNYAVVEGPVQEYDLAPYEDGWSESFTVGGVPFHYQSPALHVGFNRPAPRGGPIRPGMYVRIAHRGNAILRVDTRE